MKKFPTVFIALSFPVLMSGQLAFMPIGAVYTSEVNCSPGGPPPTHFTYQITEDTTIQGKYCTRLREHDWPFGSFDGMYVHQDGYQIYRFDEGSQEFKLALDFSKQVGEFWKVEVDEVEFDTDTLTITVTELQGLSRKVSVVGGNINRTGLLINEGFGGVYYSRLILTPHWFIFADPSCIQYVECYEDPVEGVVYGVGQHCTTATDDGMNQPIGMSIHPNPVADVLNFQVKAHHSLNHAAFRIVNAEGRLMEEIKEVHPLETFSVPMLDWPAGMYFLQYLEDGAMRAVKEFIVQK